MKLLRLGGIALCLIAGLAVGYLCVSKYRSAVKDRVSGERDLPGLEATAAVQTGESPPQNAFADPSPSSVPRAALTDAQFDALLTSRPAAAAAEVADLPEATDLRDTRLARLMEVWAVAAPQEAAEWIEGLPNGTFREEAMQELGAVWGTTDANAASEWARNEVAAGHLVPAAALLSVWGRDEPESAARWLSELSESEEASTPVLARLSGALTYAWATEDPTAAAAWVLAQQEPKIRSQSLITLAGGWAESDPDALAAWLKVHVPPDAKEAQITYVTLASHWADTHADAAGNWISRLPAGELRDTTLATFATSLAVSKPASALQWSQSIGAADAREEAALDVYETWLDEDLPAAREAIVAAIPNISERSLQHALYNLLHEKDPVFRNELYDLILPEDSPIEGSTSNNSSEKHPTATPPSPEPEIRRALPVLEDETEVKAMDR